MAEANWLIGKIIVEDEQGGSRNAGVRGIAQDHFARNQTWYNTRGTSQMRIQQILKISEQGVSRPYLCRDEKGVLRWCKGNHTGLRARISEWICGRIGRLLGLPVPACDILRLEVADFEKWREYQGGGDFPKLVTPTNLYVFASTNVEDAKDVINVVHDLRDADKLLLARIYLFDEFIHNTDRTDCNSNLLANTGVHVIDHNNAFDPQYDPVAFAKEHVLRAYFVEMPEDDALAFRQLWRQTVTEQALDEIWNEMPLAWTDVGGDILPLAMVKRILLREVR